MKLSGLDRISSRPRGGIVSVELVRASCFIGASYDPNEDCYTSVETSVPFAVYVFREDRAAYTEESSDSSGQPVVKHTLTMEFPAACDSVRAGAGLSDLSGEGFIAIITTGSNERIIAGYSSRFGTRYPLRPTVISSDSGSRPSDFPSVKIVLLSEDTEYSKPLKG